MLIILLLAAAFRPSFTVPTPFRPANGTTGNMPEVLSERAELPERFHVSSQDRTLQDIIWSCLVTIFACTWVAVHPNIPGPEESQWTRFRRRVSTMFYAIIAPELMTLWAMRQRHAAGRIKRMYNQKYHGNGERLTLLKDVMAVLTEVEVVLLESAWSKVKREIKGWFQSPDKTQEKLWTLSHGFFVQMGGFLFVQDGQPAFVITFQRLQELIDNNTIDLPSVTEEDIFDKSKGDFLTKLLVVLQTVWFIVQCIGRWAVRLPVTELEVITLAFAVLNIVTYSLWWHKPQNVQVAISIVKRSGAPSVKIESREERRSWLERKIADGGQGSEGWLPWMILVSLLVPVKLLRSVFVPLGKMATDDQVPVGSTRMPKFYADHDITEELEVIFPSLGMSVIFGALHLIPWNWQSPTNTEKLLWRVCSSVIAVEPLPAALGFGLYRLTKGYRVGEVVMLMMEAVAMSLGSLAFIGLPLYVLARLTLLVLAFSTLRSLPPDTFQDIAWSSFFPHV